MLPLKLPNSHVLGKNSVISPKIIIMHALLYSFSEIHCPNLFSLPKKLALDIASLLLSAATLDRQEKKASRILQVCYYVPFIDTLGWRIV